MNAPAEFLSCHPTVITHSRGAVSNTPQSTLPPTLVLPLKKPMKVYGPAGGARFTVTCCWQVAALPESSRAVQATVVVPAGKPAGLLLVTVRLASTMSDVVGVPS